MVASSLEVRGASGSIRKVNSEPISVTAKGGEREKMMRVKLCVYMERQSVDDMGYISDVKKANRKEDIHTMYLGGHFKATEERSDSGFRLYGQILVIFRLNGLRKYGHFGYIVN